KTFFPCRKIFMTDQINKESKAACPFIVWQLCIGNFNYKIPVFSLHSVRPIIKPIINILVTVFLIFFQFL
ncbi:hypothetical protein L9F63_010663, partial [Diploptera punctata]